MNPSLLLGGTRPLDGSPKIGELRLPAHHLTTHSVVVGMTGSGKTGLVTVVVEEALRFGAGAGHRRKRRSSQSAPCFPKLRSHGNRPVGRSAAARSQWR